MQYLSYITFGLLVATTACAHNLPTVDVSKMATESDCRHVYQQLLNIVVSDQIDPDITLSPSDYQGAQWQLDRLYQADGSKQLFLHYCQSKMTVDQSECAIHATHMEQMTICIRLVK